MNKGSRLEESKVKVLQKWNGQRTTAETLLNEFRIWVTQLEINPTKDKKHKSSIRTAEYKYSSKRNSQDKKITRIDWIEHLLQTSIEGYRKDCLWRIVGPYLLNVRNLSELEASKIMENWLGNCDGVRKLDFEPRLKIYSIIKGKKGFKPISYSKLKEENRDLYLLLEKKTALQK